MDVLIHVPIKAHIYCCMYMYDYPHKSTNTDACLTIHITPYVYCYICDFPYMQLYINT